MCGLGGVQVNPSAVFLGALLFLLTACSLVPSSPGPAAPGGALGGGAVPVGADNVVIGDVAASVTLVAFLDFECPYCSKVHPTLSALRERYSSEQLRLVIKHNPLPFHTRGMPAAVAVQAVAQLAGAETAFSYAGFLLRQPGELSDARLQGAALSHGVSLAAFATAIADERLGQQVKADMDLARRLGVTGAPAFFLNGATLSGARPYAEFERMITHELRAAEALRGAGVPKSRVYEERVRVNLRVPDNIDLANDPMRWVVPLDGSPARGPSDASVTIVEFLDLECPFCLRAHEVMSQLMQRYPKDVRWVVRHNPLPFHRQATPAATLALETLRQRGEEQYFHMLARLVESESLEPEALSELARAFELDLIALRAAWAQGADYPALQRDQDLALDLKADGTPHFFVNGRRVPGAEPFERFDALVQEELALTSELRAQGVPQGQIYAAHMARAFAPPGLERLPAVPLPSDAPSQGPESAPVVIQMFSDFECRFCSDVMRTIGGLRARYPEQVKIVFRHLPLGFHRNARVAAAVAIEARAQKGDAGFWLIVNLLFAEKERELSRSVLNELAVKAGLDTEQLRAALADGRHEVTILRDEKAAMDLGLRGTPSFIVGGYQLQGAQPPHQFERLVRKALQDHFDAPSD